jgi:hypothetical protein
MSRNMPPVGGAPRSSIYPPYPPPVSASQPPPSWVQPGLTRHSIPMALPVFPTPQPPQAAPSRRTAVSLAVEAQHNRRIPMASPVLPTPQPPPAQPANDSRSMPLALESQNNRGHPVQNPQTNCVDVEDDEKEWDHHFEGKPLQSWYKNKEGQFSAGNIYLGYGIDEPAWISIKQDFFNALGNAGYFNKDDENVLESCVTQIMDNRVHIFNRAKRGWGVDQLKRCGQRHGSYQRGRKNKRQQRQSDGPVTMPETTNKRKRRQSVTTPNSTILVKARVLANDSATPVNLLLPGSTMKPSTESSLTDSTLRIRTENESQRGPEIKELADVGHGEELDIKRDPDGPCY